jgi:hypothetical protein
MSGWVQVERDALDQAMGLLHHAAIFNRDPLDLTATGATLTVATPRAIATVPCLGGGALHVRVVSGQRFGRLLSHLPAGSICLADEGGHLRVRAGTRVFRFTTITRRAKDTTNSEKGEAHVCPVHPSML